MTTWIPWIILVPFAGSIICFIAPRRYVRTMGLLLSFGTFAVTLAGVAEISQQGVMRYALGGWRVPLGISLYADGLTAVILLMISVTSMAISLYAGPYYAVAHGKSYLREGEMFWPLWLFMWGSLNALGLSGDIFNLYVTLELVGLGAVALVTLTGSREVLIAGMRYLIATMLGSMAYLMGVAMLYAAHHTLDVHTLGRLMDQGPASAMAFALMTLGLLVKTALFPMHFWLPPAHSSASSPVSALLSALVVKGSFFVFLRLWFEMFHNTITVSAGQALGLLGAIAILWGSIQAIRQGRLKLMIAYSTVAQLGYLFLIFPVTARVPGTDEGLLGSWIVEAGKGVVYQAWSHALAKASLFMSAGCVLYAVGHDRLSALRGMAVSMPLTMFAIALAGVSLMGLPPSGGFIAKWLIMHAVLGTGQWWWIPVIVLGGLLTAAYMFMILRHAFQPADTLTRRRVPRLMEISALILAIIAILIGFRAAESLDLLMIGTPFSPDMIWEGGRP